MANFAFSRFVPYCVRSRATSLFSNFVKRRSGFLQIHIDCCSDKPNHMLKDPFSTNDLLNHHFSDKKLQNRLEELLLLADSESQLGRWPKDSKNPSSLDSEDKLDRYFIGPLVQQLNLTVVAAVKLLRFVCSITDEFISSGSLGGRLSDPTQFRLELLNPSRVLVDVFDPLSHVGVRHPHKLLAACPELLLSSAIRVESLASARETVFTQALDELSSLLPRNDLISLLTRFPGVLVRSKQELREMHTYLTEQMGLQSTESVRAAQMRAHRHFLRHATGLRLVNCPAWCLPLAHVRARHSMALLAGCWPPVTSSSEERKGPLVQQLNLTVVAAVKLLRFVCSITDEFISSGSLGGRLSDPTQFRLELLNPSRVLVDVFDPLSHVGVRHPHKLLAACPELLLSSAIRVESLASARETVFTQALDELSSLLPRNDLISLLTRFPGVLVRSKQELREMHTYLTEQMGLQSTESVRAAQMRAHRHFLRHATGLRLVNCPAWCLPLAHVRARHSMALLAGCWPPVTSSSEERKVSADQQLIGLLTCPNARVPFWLGMDSGQRTFSAMSKPLVLSPLDVDVFHFIFSRTLIESDDFPNNTECSSMKERT
ncbi:hypothetical protein AHF37_02822 [Paragonimus kellicotti]|nr:hypothetical protein AHF37_02822 [Paragonimus kellicotti]